MITLFFTAVNYCSTPAVPGAVLAVTKVLRVGKSKIFQKTAKTFQGEQKSNHTTNYS